MHVHLVFATKHRRPFLRDPVRDALHRYVAGVLVEQGCTPTLVNSVEDHIHLLFELGRKTSIAAVVETIKASSSRWIKTQGPSFAKFAWQAGYGAFAVSASNLAAVEEYVARQREHHRGRTFQDEFRAFLSLHGIAFDERYVWD